MHTLRAKHEILMMIEPGVAGDKEKGIAPKPPKTVAIAPKKLFKAQSQEQEDELIALGAASIAKIEDPDEVVDPNPAPKPATKPKLTKAEKEAAAAAAAAAAEAAAAAAAGEGDDDDDDDDDDDAKKGDGSELV